MSARFLLTVDDGPLNPTFAVTMARSMGEQDLFPAVAPPKGERRVRARLVSQRGQICLPSDSILLMMGTTRDLLTACKDAYLDRSDLPDIYSYDPTSNEYTGQWRWYGRVWRGRSKEPLTLVGIAAPEYWGTSDPENGWRWMPGRAKSTPTKYEEQITFCTLDEEQPNNLLDMIAWCGRQDTVLDQDEWILES